MARPAGAGRDGGTRRSGGAEPHIAQQHRGESDPGEDLVPAIVARPREAHGERHHEGGRAEDHPEEEGQGE